MKICFLGDTHLTFCMSVAVARRGFVPVPQQEIADAKLIFITQDTETDKDGNRNTQQIHRFVSLVETYMVPVILSSQVAPGFCKHRYDHLYHQPETLRMIDATDRALNPECIVVGCADPQAALPDAYQRYLNIFGCPILKMTYEEAEFSKIALNMALASQVDYANRMKAACEKVGADWSVVKKAVESDKRIGKYAYLTPGRWQDSIHLLRDYVTLKEIEDAR
jgi:UDPglucose 6-dehydrogenase